MNPKFYSLPQEKQSMILNAGFHVFSQNSYKKSPMSEIADAAGISKALLFHYFHNKKELIDFHPPKKHGLCVTMYDCPGRCSMNGISILLDN